LYSNPQDATCEGAASVRLMGETVIGGSESVGATLEALECRHDGRFSPCVVRSGQLTFTSVATPASPPVRRRRK
jgi:hypothetical protein